MSEKISRRDFLRKSAVRLAGLTVVPSAVLGKAAGHTAPSDKLNIAGVGRRRHAARQRAPGHARAENIVALCDADWNYAKKTFDRYPERASRYWDYRKMLDEMGKDYRRGCSSPRPTIRTASIAADAITMGKHVYVRETADPHRLRVAPADEAGRQVRRGHPDGQSGSLGRRRAQGLRLDMERRDRRSKARRYVSPTARFGLRA